ncbi:MFS transporter [Falsiroseomonas sp.]|uniref:MFS transporter n=2 Tax=Falsiroseomonas sp. TaxID=2870721 RepID=UPI00273270BE|nr:MFS transporter [Falsiroseomonas sp.]MDP3414859.1 MFS transporter [Falsiroseomonas sp.]
MQRNPAEDIRVTSPAPPLPVIMLALMAAHLAGMGAFLTVPVLAPAMAAETGVPASLAGLHTALVYAGALVTGPLTGPLIRRWGGVRMLQVSMVVLGCGIALAALGHPAALAASAVLAGMGHGPVTPGGSHLIAAHTPARRRALVFSLKQAGVPLGAMIVAALAPAIALVAGWRISILCMAAIAFLVALGIQPLRAGLDAERDRPGASAGLLAVLRESAAHVGLLRTERELARLTVMACGYGIAQFCFSTFFVAFQVASLGTPLAEAGLRLALAQAAGVVGRVGWALLADRLGASRVLAACGGGAALAGLALAMAGPGWPGFLVAAAGVVMGATAVGWNGVMLAEAARLAPPGQVGGATAALSFAFGMTMLVAPPAFSGLIALTGGYSAGFLMCVVAVTIGAFAISGARR